MKGQLHNFSDKQTSALSTQSKTPFNQVLETTRESSSNFTTFAAGVQANENPWGAIWALEDVEAMASFLPDHAQRDMKARWEWAEANETPIPMPHQPFLQITWAGHPICYRGIHLNGEAILIFQNEEDFLALNIADQF